MRVQEERKIPNFRNSFFEKKQDEAAVDSSVSQWQRLLVISRY